MLLFKLSKCFFLIVLAGAACKKQVAEKMCDGSDVFRKVRFSLYTESDFSNNNENITFTLSIRKSTGQVIWDSVLPPMKIKDIPNRNNKLIVEKIVPVNDCSFLKVGFIYAIENVGISWFWERSNPGQTLKEVDFNFR